MSSLIDLNGDSQKRTAGKLERCVDKLQALNNEYSLTDSAVKKTEINAQIVKLNGRRMSLSGKLDKLQNAQLDYISIKNNEYGKQTPDLVNDLIENSGKALDNALTAKTGSVSSVIDTVALDNAEYIVDKVEFITFENPLKNAEMSVEQNTNMIDGVINNLPPEEVQEIKAEAPPEHSQEQFGYESTLPNIAETLDISVAQVMSLPEELKEIAAALYINNSDMPKSELNDNAIDFSATSRKNNMAAITVSKSDLGTLHKCAEKVLSVAQSNEEIENPNKSEIFSKSPDDMKSLFSIEQNGETRYYLNAGNSMRDLLEKCSANTSHAALMKCGEQISEERFTEIQQGRNFAFSLDINFDEDSVSIYKVKGGVSEIDRNNNNSVIKSFKISEITENFAQKPEEQKTSSISDKINPEYYSQLKKDERKIIRLPHNSGDKAISALQSAGIPFSAVKSEKLTSITVHKDDAMALDQIISDGSKQTAKEYINSDFFKSLPPEERLYTQISGTDKANELMSALKSNNIGFSAMVDKENNSAKITVFKKDSSALKKVTESLFSRKAQKDFSDKAKSMNQEHDTLNIAKSKDNQHSI